MIQEKIVVSDTNIFLDLISVNLLDSFFLLPCDICTTDFVINEIIQPLQIQAIDKFIKSKNWKSYHLTFQNFPQLTEYSPETIIMHP